MLLYSMVALAGAYALQLFPALPPAWLLTGLLVLAVAGWAGLAGLARSRCRLVAVFISGAATLWFAAGQELADHLDPSLQGKTLTITAQVLDFPSLKGNTLRLLVHPLQPAGLPNRLRLSWFEPSARPALGETWQLEVRLRRPRGYANPSGFDYEGWLHRQGVGATGYVLRQATRVSSGDESPDLRTLLRRRFAQRIDSLFPPGESRAVLKAITVGARGEISDSQWQLYARTGTSHLMAISGLHIGLAAGGAFVLVWALLAPFVRRRNVRDLALLAAIAVAFAYAELSGFAVPAKRAFLMAAMAAVSVLVRRQVSAPHILGTVCLIVFVSDPLSIFAPGFMLSFLAVSLLLWAARVYEPADDSTRWWHAARLRSQTRVLIRIQLVLLFGLMPVTIALFGRVALLAPLTNFLVVPVFNLLTVPAALLGLLLDGPVSVVGEMLLKLAYVSIEFALYIIGMVGHWPITAVEPSISGHLVVLIAGATVAWALLPAGWPGRQVACVALIATVLYKPAPPAQNCLDFYALDVGQGLAVVLRTQQHTLVYDTGPSFRSGSSTAKLVIGPFLKSLGLSAIDLLVVSHADLDHAGGVAWLSAAFDIKRMIVGEELDHSDQPASHCRSGQAWMWEGVSFRIVHPGVGDFWQGNNASCVLLVQVGEYKLLITGDIEALAERSLVADQSPVRLRRDTGNSLIGIGSGIGPVDLVVVPHHGSRSSSGAEFVEMLRPSIAVVPAGYRNRWGFPKPDIVERWQAVGAQVVTTGQVGAVSQRYCKGVVTGPLRLQREQRRRYWHATQS